MKVLNIPALPVLSEDHQEGTIGLNYWFTPNFVLKLSYHYVDGLLAISPEEIVDPKENTNLVIFGSQFSF